MSWKYFGFIAPIYISIILTGKSEMVSLGQIVATNTVYKIQGSFVVLKLLILFVGLGLLLSPETWWGARSAFVMQEAKLWKCCDSLPWSTFKPRHGP